MTAFAVRLRELRERRGLSQRELAELCGMTRKTIHRYENGQREPSLEHARVLAEFFRVSLDEVCGRR